MDIQIMYGVIQYYGVIQIVEQVQEDDLQVDVDEQVEETMTRQAKATLPQVSSGWPQEAFLVGWGRLGGPDALAAILGPI